jgi:ligand-binding sensor domain-containing protein
VKRLLIYIITLLLHCHAIAQGYTVKNYSVEHGLPFVQVRGLVQDSNGYMYAFGYGNIGKFDGKNFSNIGKNFGINEYNILSLTINKSNNDLWVGTSNGLSKISKHNVLNAKLGTTIKNYGLALKMDYTKKINPTRLKK